MSVLRKWLFRLMQDRRVAPLLDDPRVQRAMFTALKTRGRVEEQTDRVLEHAARRLNLATAREVRDLKRHLRRLEERLPEAQADE